MKLTYEQRQILINRGWHHDIECEDGRNPDWFSKGGLRFYTRDNFEYFPNSCIIVTEESKWDRELKEFDDFDAALAYVELVLNETN